MASSRTETISRIVDEEVGRDRYPADMPALPEIPSARYADPRFHDLEMKHMWTKTWLNAGHVSEIADNGSYKLWEQLGLSIIISRGTDGEIRAFHNICRHRGSALLQKPSGRAPRFICPYHGWGYDSQGRLASVPDPQDFACLDKSERGLMPVRCEVLRGLIFINLDMDAAPLDEFGHATALQIGDFPLEKFEVKGVITVEMECNWKIAYDNFLEIYHVKTVHAKSIADNLFSKSFSVSLYENGHARFITRKRGGSSVFGKDGASADRPDDLFMEYTVALPIFPNTFMPIDPIGFTCQGYWPLGPDRSVMVMYMLGWKSDDPADGEFWSGMRKQIEGIIDEDLELFASLQRTANSGRLPGLTVNWQERAIYWYQEEIDRIIGADRIPQEMRVPPMLAHLAETGD